MNRPQYQTRARAARRTAGGISLLAAASLAGCGDFLATEPRGQLTTESFFDTQEQALQATNATYSMLRNWTVHVFAWLGMTEIASDDATKGSVPGDANFLGDLDNLNFDPALTKGCVVTPTKPGIGTRTRMPSVRRRYQSTVAETRPSKKAMSAPILVWVVRSHCTSGFASSTGDAPSFSVSCCPKTAFRLLVTTGIPG